MLTHTFLITNAKTKPYYCIWERKMKSKFWRSWQQRQQQLKPFYDSERNGNGLVEERILSTNNNTSVTCKTSFITFANQFKATHSITSLYDARLNWRRFWLYCHDIPVGPSDNNYIDVLKCLNWKTKDCVDKMTYVITFV